MNGLYLALGAALIGGVALGLYGAAQRRKGALETKLKETEADNAKADDIRDAVHHARADGVRDDEIQYRD